MLAQSNALNQLYPHIGHLLAAFVFDIFTITFAILSIRSSLGTHLRATVLYAAILLGLAMHAAALLMKPLSPTKRQFSRRARKLPPSLCQPSLPV